MNGCYFYISHFFFCILHLIKKSRGNGKLPLDTTQKPKSNPFPYSPHFVR